MKTAARTFTCAALALLPFVPGQAGAATWLTNTPLKVARQDHTATILPSGKVLIAGGHQNAGPYLSSAELYDPATRKWTNTGTLNMPRAFHTATLLSNGKVLVAGGFNGSMLSSAELYDPATGQWSTTGLLTTGRSSHTAALLTNGLVLIAGGIDLNGRALASVELYNPASGAWTATGPLQNARFNHTATLLSGGQLLVVGGTTNANTGARATTELYDPASGTWTFAGSLNAPRSRHTSTLLPNGKVLVVEGSGDYPAILSSAELYDPANRTWKTTGGLTTPRYGHAATLMPNGKVLVTGGYNGSVNVTSCDYYDPATETWTATVAMATPRREHAATLLPSGRVLVAGGFSNFAPNTITNVELYEWDGGTWTTNGATWTNTGAMDIGRELQTGTLLPNGKVLVSGGGTSNGLSSSAAVYDPGTETWSATNSMNAARYGHSATLLPNGNVLVTGGQISGNSYLASAEFYAPATGQWSFTGSLLTARSRHTATLLPNGKLLVAGGVGDTGFLSSAELYDPASGAWRATGSMTTNRESHTATLLPNGKVLVVGGRYGYPTNFGTLDTAELFDPANETWTQIASLSAARNSHGATLLPNGTVLVVGGNNGVSISPTNSAGYSLSSAEVFNPATGTWTLTGSMTTFRDPVILTLLPRGLVLAIGGDLYSHSAELYEPATGTWTLTGFLTVARQACSATLLPGGKVLVAGGLSPSGGYPFSSAELYDSGPGFTNSWQPQIATLNSPLGMGSSLALTGSQFRGISGASGGTSQDSPSDFPLVQLRSIESGQTTFLLSTNWSTNSFTSLPLTNFPPGYALATVFVNGIPSTSSVVNVSVPVPTPTTLTAARRFTNGSFQFFFTNNPGALFAVLATTNISLPLSNWIVLSGVTESSPGHFQFSDPQTANAPQRYYRIRSP